MLASHMHGEILKWPMLVVQAIYGRIAYTGGIRKTKSSYTYNTKIEPHDD